MSAPEFDPEKVERWTTPGILTGDKGGTALNPVREYVIAYDYDKLLEMYRAKCERCIELGERVHYPTPDMPSVRLYWDGVRWTDIPPDCKITIGKA